MKRRLVRAGPAEEGESYYASMTDMMIGVVFIFIILMAFLGLNYRGALQTLTSARDAETTALLAQAQDLQPLELTARIDRGRRVLCVPTTTLAGQAVRGDEGAERCFAYGRVRRLTDAPDDAERSALQARQLLERLRTDLRQADAPMAPVTGDQNLSFDAEVVFAPGTAALTERGRATVAAVAERLDAVLPCMGYQGPPRPCTGIPRHSRVSVVTTVSTDPFTPEGRAALTLAFERSAAFHGALIAARPSIRQVRAGPFGGAEPLLQVAAFGESQRGGSGTSIVSLEFVP